jgi:preprotein translocase subunit SecB
LNNYNECLRSATQGDILLVESNAVCRKLPAIIFPKDIDVKVDFNVEHEYNKESGDLICFVSCKVNATDRKNPKDAPFDIYAKYALFYNFNNSKDLITKNILEYFNTGVALFSAYPFLREHIRSKSAAMGLNPPFVLPLIKYDPPKTPTGAMTGTSNKTTKKVSKKTKK